MMMRKLATGTPTRCSSGRCTSQSAHRPAWAWARCKPLPFGHTWVWLSVLLLGPLGWIAGPPAVLSTSGLVTYLQGLFGRLLLGIVGNQRADGQGRRS
jgi:hypothetical protein